MKRIRRIKIKFQTNELLILRPDASQSHNNSATATVGDIQSSIVHLCPLCCVPLLSEPVRELLGTINKSVSFDESDEH